MDSLDSDDRHCSVGDRPPGKELTAFLWIVAGLLAVLDIAWLAVDRLFPG